jgi:hypothetical protein
MIKFLAERQEHVCALSERLGIVHQELFPPALLPGSFAMSETASLPKTTEAMVES